MRSSDTAIPLFLNDFDLICFSHLRWTHVFQRPQHLLTRFAKHTRVIFIEEPQFHDAPDECKVSRSGNIYIVTPMLKDDFSQSIVTRQQQMIRGLFSVLHVNKYFFWFYTPMALPLTENLTPDFVVYDCMDELSAFRSAPIELKSRERLLLQMSDIVFTGGKSIYECKKKLHTNLYCFPSSIEKHHFGKAREVKTDPADQAPIPHPRFGFAGVIDERMDLQLLAEVAKRNLEWHFIILGPIAKISRSALPSYENIHYLGQKNYDDLPHYMSGWDIAIIPFALNEHTQFISPTKTPEYLAAGKPVISTAIRDVVSPYEERGLVRIARSSDEFIDHANLILKMDDRKEWLEKVDGFLSNLSWDTTWEHMTDLIQEVVDEKKQPDTKACA